MRMSDSNEDFRQLRRYQTVMKMRQLIGELLTFLLSSRTVFMLSIHRVSMGPSKMTHLRISVWSEAYSRKVLATTPSVHYRRVNTVSARQLHNCVHNNLKLESWGT